MAGGVKGIGKFFGDVVAEMKRVSWPTRKELTRYTLVVLGTVAFITVFFAVVDYGISALVRGLIE
ncbi:preprotein translocase subunit SecE [Halalkalibacterium halodurans]|uniref:Protein translocase subunit SecE n=2 Tax=Halalkalibacterium halodurans TaxID=86665 RepID=SECE_HALH5|nr:preprotein translocase subunit SecE [Halalkalibacterium halodurans]Q9KGE8.1 RecName: Full=Protein translocase subunit SecE [Halalkalibacterium halodurans C-125]MDY7220619.1 preprotein translocase subunit SecE [Halalkalibacterium halodurans]MDY7239858.1 preprotein translocase subunit SecE [Halalkalibacterium halodurans]MED3647890.1 preprotein translocase subunit SecE [Halalkalibacterium halodurans]MED4081223.1 preprotein translocase subunit SecE [Halalkalibacterium halodurans]MED4083938.1 p